MRRLFTWCELCQYLTCNSFFRFNVPSKFLLSVGNSQTPVGFVNIISNIVRLGDV